MHWRFVKNTREYYPCTTRIKWLLVAFPPVSLYSTITYDNRAIDVGMFYINNNNNNNCTSYKSAMNLKCGRCELRESKNVIRVHCLLFLYRVNDTHAQYNLLRIPFFNLQQIDWTHFHFESFKITDNIRVHDVFTDVIIIAAIFFIFFFLWKLSKTNYRALPWVFRFTM